MTRRILHIDLDAFFVSVEQVLAPELAGKPVIVGGRPERRGVVASASYEARAYSVRAAMPLAQAYRLCPQAIFLQGDFRKYRDFSARFMNILADFSPSLEPGGLDEAYLDVTGCDIFGTPFQIAKKIKERVRKELGLIASVGIASCKVVAKVASDAGKPDGLVEVPVGGERSFLAPLPVVRLPGVGDKTEQMLVVMGVKTIGQLADLPLELLKSRFGTFGVMLHEHANGIDDSKVEMYGEVKSISRETTLERDTLDSQFLEGVLRHLSEKVGADLRHEGKRARSVVLKLRYSDFETITRRFTPRESLASDEVIFAEAVRLLSQALAKKRKPVRLIGVGVSNLVGEARQLAMFDQTARRLELLDKTIDRIRRKYGFAAIQTGRTFALRDIFSEAGED
ncbi:MAG: DNA polymerase IV [Chloroflexi bacterium]|nr:DNA polymerase IV [Chloroflexota bacterium]